MPAGEGVAGRFLVTVATTAWARRVNRQKMKYLQRKVRVYSLLWDWNKRWPPPPIHSGAESANITGVFENDFPLLCAQSGLPAIHVRIQSR